MVIQQKNFDAQKVFLNTFENIVNKKVDIPEDMGRFQKTFQYAGSKVDYAIGDFIYILPSDTNLWIGKIQNYNNKMLVSSSSFNIETNSKINLDDDKPDIKPNIKFKKQGKQDIKTIKTKPDMNEITYEEENAGLILGMAAIFTVWWMFK